VVVFELLRAALGAIGLNGTLALGIAVVLVGVYYSRELAGFLMRLAQVLSIAGLVLGAVGLLIVVGLATGWIEIETGLLGDALRAVGELAGFGGSH